MVFGTLEKKDQHEIFKIFPTSLRYYFCTVPSDRSMSIEKIESEGSNKGLNYSLHDSVSNALDTAIKDSDVNDTILVTGSTFLLSEINKF